MHHLAIGDPQAPFATFLRILEGHGLLADDGRLRRDVHLVSMGDHFDYGPPEQRARAAIDGEALLAWLAAHSAEQVTILLGNHDLARVCELNAFTDETFSAAAAEARKLSADRRTDPAFALRYPTVPDPECLARDYACFAESQRVLVTELLRSGRLRLAASHQGLLLNHAGVTVDDLSALGLEADDADAVASGLNRFLDERVDGWTGQGPLDLKPFHQPGSALTGEGRGALSHRPCDPSTQEPSRLEGPPRRRFDPRRLPAAFPQAIGHIRDAKCRELMPRWSPDDRPQDGPLRSLTVGGADVTYQLGCAADARLFFTDGGMSHAAPDRYELLDLDRRQPLPRPTR